MWTAPRTWIDGELVPASYLNTQIRDNFLFLNPFGSPARSASPIPFDAGRFTGVAPMTWTVDAGDRAAEYYTRCGNRIFYVAQITTSVFGGSASPAIQIGLPDGMTILQSGFQRSGFMFAGGVVAAGSILPGAGATAITISLTNGANFTLPEANFYVYVAVSFAVRL
jgi:hypothetical protein